MANESQTIENGGSIMNFSVHFAVTANRSGYSARHLTSSLMFTYEILGLTFSELCFESESAA